MEFTVLLVDDMKFIRDDIKRRLRMSRDHTYRVVAESEDGEQAIAAYFEHKPDIVLLDLILPLFSGIDVAKEILSRDSQANICLIAAMGHEVYIQQALQIGVKDFVIKPFESEIFLQRLSRVLLPPT